MADFDRIERPHFVGYGTQLLIADPDRLEEAQLDEVPTPTLALFEGWAERREAVPPSLAWAAEELGAREAVLERASFGHGVTWTVRLPVCGRLESLGRPCLGANGFRTATELPTPLDWIAALGRLDISAQRSGTAAWGASLAERRAEEMLPWMLLPGDAQEDLIQLPDGSDDWLELYEVDGDSVFADPENGRVVWLGGEWTGEQITTIDLDWRAAAHFIFWRLLEARHVRPADLQMLAAAR